MRMRLAAFGLCGAAIIGGEVEAAECRLALTLAVDVSSSVDTEEYRLQIEGIAGALKDPEVRASILQRDTTVALQVFEWSGESDQSVIKDWTTIATSADLDRLADELVAHERPFLGGQTALGQAIDFALTQLQRGPACWEAKIDVSGDGQTNEGIRPQDLYWKRSFGDVTVNGLAIESNVPGLFGYYQDFVIRGPDAFVIRARNYADFARAMREKLIRELGVPQLGMLETR
jgi:hypothetical protein